MATNFNADELQLLADTPHVLGAVMASAGNSGWSGTGKEVVTNARSTIASVKDYPNNALIQAIFPNPGADRSEAMEKTKKIRDWSRARLQAKGKTSADQCRDQALKDAQAVAALLSAEASPEKATEYKQRAMEKVANAGGFLRFRWRTLE